MKKLLLFLVLLGITQVSSAAILRVKNGSTRDGDKKMKVTIYWQGGQTSKFIIKDDSFHIMDSGINAITAISWEAIVGASPGIKYRVTLAIGAFSVSHKLEILPLGIYRYDGVQAKERAVAIQPRKEEGN